LLTYGSPVEDDGGASYVTRGREEEVEEEEE
jgi:hypothetical protein